MILIHDTNTDAVRVINGNDLDFCKKKEILCYIPQNRAGSAQGMCARTLFFQKEYQEIMRSCLFKCEVNSETLTVQQIDKEVFSLVNVKSPLIIADTVNKKTQLITVNETWPGAVLITVHVF